MKLKHVKNQEAHTPALPVDLVVEDFYLRNVQLANTAMGS